MLNVRLDEEMEARLSKLSIEKSVTKSEIVKSALADYLDKQQHTRSAYDLGKDLFGVASGGSKEDSSNYKQKLKAKLHAKNSH
ncbi:MAG: ribbon-helix-helix domain-containing protein [Chitinophagaceae bacterium]|jgi:predicted DNA-binding protein|nr:ribbon-helix-helix domain-containing protein [Chitinophagaceae bacterium]